ncbi:hypothetical protein TTHERM_00149610 (macronuclear) [Tetrahymena thermophila SB210]|uniref:Uncharacterized protein n=1 Tax=Tetrahymena thermophila (strain SB210) TaxID=312017 RepID=I7LWC1_TETTS|nr:hypothetical protein TTHERM_00149610 [Tetrahymena thermophila SB210]EAS01351.2 hypothetical protein TTHERM_00149610 [Tetrahymena thermophila SB210]|eukprot:XP_001021596.2 hypothetical protein TTHERM_00149610 [Tetrahymena thermophila SB210]
MFNLNTPINPQQRLMSESDRNQSSTKKIHTCPSHLAAGILIQSDHQSKHAQKVYCDACIIQFYHRSNTFLSNFNIGQQIQLNQNGNALINLGQKTIDKFNNSLILTEQEEYKPNFIMDCQSNCKERNKEITMQQQLTQKQALIYLQNMQQNYHTNPETQNSIQPQGNSFIPPNHQNQNQEQQNQFVMMQAQQNTVVTYNYQNPDAFRSSTQHNNMNNHNIISYNNQCQMQQGQQQIVQNPSMQQLNEKFQNQTSNNTFYSTQIQQINQLNTPQSQLDEINLQAKNFSLSDQPIHHSMQNPLELQYLQQNNMILQNQSASQSQNQQSYQDIFQYPQARQEYNMQYNSGNNNYNNQNSFNNFDNQQKNQIIIPSEQQLVNGFNQQNQQNIQNGRIISLELSAEKKNYSALQFQLNQNSTTSNKLNSSDASAQIQSNSMLPYQQNEKQLVLKQCGLKKINQQIKHANRQYKQQSDSHNQGQNELHISYRACDEEFIDEEEMKLVLGHEYQQELYSKNKRQQNKRLSQEAQCDKLIKKQSQIKQTQAVGKSKEIEKKKSDKSKKQQNYVVSRWCPQSQQLLFEWNNTPLKQIQLQSDKIVNESVNVASYVNILNKNRIMIISQNTCSLKYQINLIDLQENRVICKNQLGSNFQLYPFEPSKLNVQTVKINERLSCIYLMGGSYFKIIKNSSLNNVKRVKQFCIQQILPIYKGRQVVALSLNGLINIYSTAQDNFHLIKSMKIKRESPISISYVNYFDVDTENSLIYCCVLSNRTQFIQIFNMFTGEIIYTQDIHILQQNYGYNITNMKIFQNHLYIELQLQQDEHHHPVQSGCEVPIQFKVQAYKIDNQSHHLNEFKTYNHSNILKSTFSSQQFFLYNSQKSCIIGFEKLNQKKYKHYLTPSSNQLCMPNQQMSSNLIPIDKNEKIPMMNQEQLSLSLGESSVNEKIFKLNIKQTSPKFRPIFTHIFKEIPHGHQSKQKKQISSICNQIPNYQQSLAQNYSSQFICEQELNQIQDNQDMVLTLFDQNKNVYKIYQN